MFGLKKSKIKAAKGYKIFNIPNERNIKIGIHDDGDYITIIGKCTNGWYRLGDRMDLIPDKLKDFGLTSYRGSNKSEQQLFIEKIINFEEFNQWVKSDNVVKEGENEYRTQCTLYKKGFTYDELFAYFKREYLTV